MDKRQLASYIDHTNLKPTSRPEDIEKLCKEATENHFCSVCVNPVYVSQCSKYFKEHQSDVKVCTVIGFPLGSTSTEAKVEEARVAIESGAEEVDMVIQIGLMKAGQYDAVKKDIQSVAECCKSRNALLKVIIEICYLTEEEIEKASVLTFEAGAQFVKTSTGFGSGGATVEAVRIMSAVAKKYGGKVKAAGGIRTYQDALNMINAGAYAFELIGDLFYSDRIGTSGGIAILSGCDH